jgi:hypothetical protein
VHFVVKCPKSPIQNPSFVSFVCFVVKNPNFFSPPALGGIVAVGDAADTFQHGAFTIGLG